MLLVGCEVRTIDGKVSSCIRFVGAFFTKTQAILNMELFLIIATSFIYFGRKAYTELRWVQQIIGTTTGHVVRHWLFAHIVSYFMGQIGAGGTENSIKEAERASEHNVDRYILFHDSLRAADYFVDGKTSAPRPQHVVCSGDILCSTGNCTSAVGAVL